MSGPNCPAAPSMDEKFNDISRTLDALGASQKCKSYFDAGAKESSTSVSVAVTASVLFASASAATNVSTGASQMHQKMAQDGCGDVFSNISEQVNARQAIMCQINNQQTTTNLSGSATASVNIRQRALTDNERTIRKDALNLILPVPFPQQPVYLPGMKPDEYKMMLAGYKLALAAYKEHQKLVKEALDSVSGKVIIKRLSVKNKASVDMQAVTKATNISTTAIQQSFKRVAQASAEAEIKKKTGVTGDTTKPVKALIQNKINEKNQEISSSIKNSINSVELGANAMGKFELIFSGPLDMSDVIIDQYAHARLITKNIIENAEKLGKATALEMITKTTSTATTDTEAAGMEDIAKEIQAGRAAQATATASGIAEIFEATGLGGMGMIATVVVLIFVLPMFMGGGGGIFNLLIFGAIAYFGAAYYFGFWPFNPENKKKYDEKLPIYVLRNLESPYGGLHPFKVNQSWKHQ